MAVVPSPISEIPCEARITWYVNDVVVSEVDMGLNEMTPLIWEFDTPGTHAVTLRVCNCCGCCTYEEEVNSHIMKTIYGAKLLSYQIKLEE